MRGTLVTIDIAVQAGPGPGVIVIVPAITPNHKVSTRALLPGAQASFAPANGLRSWPLGMHERASRNRRWGGLPAPQPYLTVHLL